MGKGVLKAIENVKTLIAPAIAGMNPVEQEAIDKKMMDLDGTPNKTKLGANAILAVSLAVCKAGAAQKGVPLYRHIAELAGTGKLVMPVPWMNVINGGSHAGNRLAMQEFMIGATGATTFKQAMQMGCEVYHNLKNVIKKKYGQVCQTHPPSPLLGTIRHNVDVPPSRALKLAVRFAAPGFSPIMTAPPSRVFNNATALGRSLKRRCWSVQNSCNYWRRSPSTYGETIGGHSAPHEWVASFPEERLSPGRVQRG